MDYTKLLTRALDLIWEHKFLLLLGILVVLGGGSGVNFNANYSGGRPQTPGIEIPGQIPGEIPEIPGLGELNLSAIPLVVIVLVIGGALIVGLILWVISTAAHGGLIAGVQDVESGRETGFRAAFNAGIARIWTLLGISLLPALPALLLALGGLVTGGVFMALLQTADLPVRNVFLGLMAVFGFLACLLTPVLFILNFLRMLADRACMLEDLGMLAAYSRAFDVLKTHLVEALILLGIQIVISVGLGFVLAIPGIFMSLCCLFWPVLLAVQGAIAAYFSALWTLAWREWAPPRAKAAWEYEAY